MISHLIELPVVLRENASDRLCQLHSSLKGQDYAVQSLFEGLMNELMAEEDVENELLDVLFPLLNSEEVQTMEDMMEGPVGRFVKYILSDDYFRLFQEFLKIEKKCALSLYSMTVPTGGQRPLLHMNAIDCAIKNLFFLNALEWDDERLLYSCVIEESADGKEWFLPDTSYIIREFLTVKLASGEQKVIEFLADELNGEDYSDVSCQIFITSILKCANQQLLQSVVNLFRHQEDYFDTFVKQVFEVHQGIAPESMLFLLESIQTDHELRAVLEPQLYLLLYPKHRLKIGSASCSEVLSWAADCLRNPDLKQQMLTDANPQKVYVALWTIGFCDADAAWNVANELIKDGRSLSKNVVLTYYRNNWAKLSLEVITQRINQQN